ncbi:MAG: AAA family ATPase [Lachnospiraceae bacterium]|nr:AAA family ATPase [Lachnospiraceae bacterium]
MNQSLATQKESTLKIKVTDFLSIKYAEFEIQKGISVIAGKNGSGKSQLLLGIAQKISKSNLAEEMGFSRRIVDIDVPQIEIEEMPKLVLYRPPIRELCENDKSVEYGFCRPLNQFINSNDLAGYTNQIQNRAKNIYSIISNFAISATNEKADEAMKERWRILTDTFNKVFGKELLYDINIFNGIKVGVQVDSNTISSFNTLSTGELELIALMCDLLLEYNIVNPEDGSGKEINKMTQKTIDKADMILIDELDSHFHPDLQRRILGCIKDLCQDKYVIITTHSPSVMLSVSPDRLFYLQKHQDSFSSKGTSCRNQITKISEDYTLFQKISELYSGFSTDTRYAELLKNSESYELIKFAAECMRNPEVFEGEKGKEQGSQEFAIQNFILSFENPVIVEIGCGLGRTLAAFNSFDPDYLKTISYYGVDIEQDNVNGILEYAEENHISCKFKDFNAGLSFDKKADVCIFANVIHEIPRKDLANELTKYLNYLNPGGKAMILECLELPVGEKDYVVLNFDALKLLLDRSINKGALSMHQSTPKTYSGIPLMHVVITVHSPEDVEIRNEDVRAALEYTVKNESRKLYQHFSEKELLKSKSFAHVTHNLAHAQMALCYFPNNPEQL